ncbi:ankyrin repeat domain-containing protein 39-like isoform X1 [Pararge aegeria]|uniref:Jg9328 protein n=2 Tax=Pararge aegeria TaxID=116150 RepID=A0A8S4S1B6_9NEOP|nr:ankyrin repeat domain-containing protein 39-like isoform X1 [Pararge aegeria]CAH2243411.1 jg9328 [Pararge aegeria aegeria]
MDVKDVRNHSNCNAISANESVRQTLSEMEWERSIWNAAFSGEKDRVLSLISKASSPKELVNSQDNSGYTALHYAARNGHVDICSILLKNGAYINTQTRCGKATPLHKAAAAGKEATVKYLIQHRAQLDLQDADGKTALHKVVENKKHGLINVLLEACPKLRDIKDNKGILAIE